MAGYRARSGLIGLAVDRNELVELAPEALIKADCAKINRVHWDGAPDAHHNIQTLILFTELKKGVNCHVDSVKLRC